jgi:two-component system sensor histidine kinase HydH
MPKEWSAQEIKCIVRLSSLINSSLDIIDVLDNSMHAVEDVTNAETSSIFEVDFEKNELFFRLARGKSGSKVGQIRMKMGEGIAGWVASSGEALLVPDARSDKRFCKKVDDISCFRTKSIVALPIRYKGTITGVLEVLNKRGPHSFDDRDLEVLSIAVNQIGIAMENAKLYARLKEKFILTRSELKKAEEKLIRSERLAALGQLSQGIAHAVRNPVMSIGGFARRLKKKLPDDATASGYIDRVLEESERLEMMVKDVWAYTSMPEPKVKEIRISALFQNVVEDGEREKGSKNIQFNLELLPEDPVVFVDMKLMVKALRHLLVNAEEAVSGGGIITVSAWREEKWIVISVKDSGSGIASEDLPYAFDPFFTTKIHGSGLGLTTVNRIVSEHCGEIRIISQQGSGTEVKIYLPPSVKDHE